MNILTKNVMILMFLMVIVCEKSNGETYKVGDSVGWTNTSLFDFKAWAAIKTFRVGDNILFEYNKEYHNVERVTHKNFNLCNATAPYGIMQTGHDVFKIKKPGHFYFICGLPGHCETGQRVDIRVLEKPEPKPISPSSPPSSFGTAPAPSRSGTFSSCKDLFQRNLGLTFFAFLSVAYGFDL